MAQSKTQEKGEAKISTGVRISQEQINALTVEAERMNKRTKGMRVGYTTVIGFAIDDYIARLKAAKREAATR